MVKGQVMYDVSHWHKYLIDANRQTRWSYHVVYRLTCHDVVFLLPPLLY